MRRLAFVVLLVALLPVALAAAPCCDEQRGTECCDPGGACPTLPNGACLQTSPKLIAAPSGPGLEQAPALVPASAFSLFASPHESFVPAPRAAAAAFASLAPGPLRL